MVWCCEFTSIKVKEVELVLKVVPTAIAHLAHQRNIKMAHKNTAKDN